MRRASRPIESKGLPSVFAKLESSRQEKTQEAENSQENTQLTGPIMGESNASQQLPVPETNHGAQSKTKNAQ